MSVNDVIEMVKKLDWEDRVAVFKAFCVHCGDDDDPWCRCWDDS